MALKEGTWARSCTRCGFGNNIKLDSEIYSDCECQKDSVRILDWNKTAKPPSPLCSMPMPAPPPLKKKTAHCGSDKDSSHQCSRMQTHQIYARTQQLQQSRKLNMDGKMVLRYTDANIQKPAVLSRVLPNSFPKLTSRYGGTNNSGTSSSINGNGNIQVRGSYGHCRSPRDSTIEHCIETNYRVGAKLTVVNTHFF